MKICKAVPTFILLFTGYYVKNCVAATESVSESLPPLSSVTYSTQGFQQPTPSTDIPDSGSTSSSTAVSNVPLLVAGVSISFVLFSICVIIGVWNARKWSKQDSYDITSTPSGEA